MPATLPSSLYMKSDVDKFALSVLLKDEVGSRKKIPIRYLNCEEHVQKYFYGGIVTCSGAFAEVIFKVGKHTAFFSEAYTDKLSAFTFFLVEGLKLIENLDTYLQKGDHEACTAVIKTFKALTTFKVYELHSLHLQTSIQLVETGTSNPLPDEHRQTIDLLGASAEKILKEYKQTLSIEDVA